jgi:hypothetical protein
VANDRHEIRVIFVCRTNARATVRDHPSAAAASPHLEPPSNGEQLPAHPTDGAEVVGFVPDTNPRAGSARVPWRRLLACAAALDQQPNNPLHGVTLQAILEFLVERIGWDAMARAVDIRCFTHEPSLTSSLKFLRKVPWARAKVEALYLTTQARMRARS